MELSFNAKFNEFTTNMLSEVYILNNIFISTELAYIDVSNRKRF